MSKKLVLILILSLHSCSPPPPSHDNNRPPASFPPPSAGPPRSLTTSAPPPQSPPPTPSGTHGHPRRPENCSIATVMYDSCNPRHPNSNDDKASREEKEFFPENMSSGFMTDAAGCCLGFAMFSNDCRAATKDLSFAKRKIYNKLKDECNNRYY